MRAIKSPSPAQRRRGLGRGRACAQAAGAPSHSCAARMAGARRADQQRVNIIPQARDAARRSDGASDDWRSGGGWRSRLALTPAQPFARRLDPYLALAASQPARRSGHLAQHLDGRTQARSLRGAGGARGSRRRSRLSRRGCGRHVRRLGSPRPLDAGPRRAKASASMRDRLSNAPSGIAVRGAWSAGAATAFIGGQQDRGKPTHLRAPLAPASGMAPEHH